MTGLDIAVLILVGLGAVTGFLRGFVEEVIALSAWVLSLIAIHYLHTPVANYLEPIIGTASGAGVLAFAFLLLIPYAIIKLVAKSAGSASRNSVLGPIDRIIGFGFGAVKGILIVIVAFSILVLGYDMVWGIGGRPDWITQSRSYPFVNASSEALVKMIAERRHAAAEAETKSLKKK